MIAIILFGCAPWCSSEGSEPCTETPQPGDDESHPLELPVQAGDIIFIAVPNYLFRQVSLATQCPSNHVGIVFHDPVKGWLVAESAVPLSRYTPLSKFIARSKDGWCVLRRDRNGLNECQVTALRAQCDARMGIFYNAGFGYESKGLFCSKFVHDVYLSALGTEIGEMETFSHLLARNPRAGLTFWRAWFFGRIPWNRLTVTPASQFESPLLVTAWESCRGGCGNRLSKNK